MTTTPVSFPRILADLFPGRDRWLLLAVFAMGFIAAIFETIGVASILPFMSLVLDPSGLERYAVIRTAMRLAGITTTQGGLLLVGVGTVMIVAFGNLAGAANVYVQQRFAARTETRFSATLFAGYLRQPYAFHVHRDAPSLLKILTTDIYLAVQGVILPFNLGLSKLVMAIAVVAVLIVRDPLTASLAVALLAVAYGLIYRFYRRSQQALGIAANAATEERARLSQEALGGVKELQVLGRLDRSIDEFGAASWRGARAHASQLMVGQLPRYVMETVAFGGILLFTIVQVARSPQGAQAVVPVLALYAFAGYRLMPALQQVFSSVVSIRFYLAGLRHLHADFVQVSPRGALPADERVPAGTNVRLTKAIEFDDVSFTYAGAVTPALERVSLTVRPLETVGLIGRTGAGKTTVADLVLGLYEPTSGQVRVDGVALVGPAVKAWQRRVGYVPQAIFLANASVTENIALGVPRNAIDAAAVQRAAQMAHADEFVRSLPNGYDTVVGERGVKLSGGQRQRIGIARALYHQPDMLIFDEATSALDGLTEEAVMEATRSLSGDRTIMLIAHRIRTVEACDRIVMLDQGRIIADGSYETLLATSEPFRRFVGRHPVDRPRSNAGHV